MFRAHWTAGTASTHSQISRLFSCIIAFNARITSLIIRSQVPFDQGELVTAILCSTRGTPSSVFMTRFLKCEAVSLTHTSGTLNILHHLSRCFVIDAAAVHDSVCSNHTKLLNSSSLTNIHLIPSPSSNPSLPCGPLSPTYTWSNYKTSPGLVACRASPSGCGIFSPAFESFPCKHCLTNLVT